MRNAQLYATGSATGTSVAQITIPTAGKIRGVQIAMVITSITAAALVAIEFSKVPTNQVGINGATDPFLEVRQTSNFVTSGLSTSGLNQFFPLSVDMLAGQVIYAHATVSGTATYYITALFIY